MSLSFSAGFLPCPGYRAHPSLPHTGQPAEGPALVLTLATLAGKDMEPNGPSLPRDEGPPTPSSATKGPPVRA